VNWHNPHNLDTAGGGWRFLRPGEALPGDAQMWALYLIHLSEPTTPT